MVKRTITITTILLILTIAVGLILMLNKPSFGADDIASGTCGTCSWVIDSEGVLTISPADGVSGTLSEFTSMNFMHDWQDNNLKEEIKKIVVEDGVKTGQECYRMFGYLTNCTEMELSRLDTSSATNMAYMFDSCTGLTSIDVSRFNTENVTDMTAMFSNCINLSSIDVTSFDTRNVTKMADMFGGCIKLASINVSGFNTENVTEMDYMFFECLSLTSIDLSNFNTDKVIVMSGMFYNCKALVSMNISSFNTSKVINMEYMFSKCEVITSIDVTRFDTSSVTNMHNMFAYCYSLSSINVTGFNTENVTDMSCMFLYCNALTSIDVSNFNTEKVTNMIGMFAECDALSSIDISGVDSSNATNMGGMFLNLLNLDKINLGKNFSFDGKGNIVDNNKALLPTPTGDFFTGKWIREDKAFGPYTAEELRDNYDGSTMAGIWIRERKPLTVTYSYTGTIPEGASELPEAKTYEVGENVTVAPDATALGYTFSGWSRTGTFEMPAENVLITGSFTAVTDTANNIDEKPEEPTSGIKDEQEEPSDIKDETKPKETIVESKIEEIKGVIFNPKTSDFVQNYLIYGIIGMGVFIVVMRLRGKFSRKAKKIQY